MLLGQVGGAAAGGGDAARGPRCDARIRQRHCRHGGPGAGVCSLLPESWSPSTSTARRTCAPLVQDRVGVSFRNLTRIALPKSTFCFTSDDPSWRAAAGQHQPRRRRRALLPHPRLHRPRPPRRRPHPPRARPRRSGAHACALYGACGGPHWRVNCVRLKLFGSLIDDLQLTSPACSSGINLF